MRTPRAALLLIFVLVAFGISLAVPAEDLAGTAYDESETLPCQSPAPAANGVPEATSKEVQTPPQLIVTRSSFALSARAHRPCLSQRSLTRRNLALLCVCLC